MIKNFFKKPVIEFDEQVDRICKNCENSFKGRYCNRCGEKVIEPYERSIRFFLDSVFNAFTFVEGKFWNTLKNVFVRPGQYSLDFAEGIRQRYMKPIAFFFVANVIFFLFPVFANTFASTLQSQRTMQLYGPYASRYIDDQMQERGMSFEELAEVYDVQSVNLTKSLLVLMIPLFAIFVAPLNYGKRKYLSDHLLFSSEFNAYMLFCNLILLPGILLPTIYVLKQLSISEINMYDSVLLPIIATTSLYFLISAERRFYNQKWWRAIGKGTFLFGLFFISLLLYRFILFHLTMWSI